MSTNKLLCLLALVLDHANAQVAGFIEQGLGSTVSLSGSTTGTVSSVSRSRSSRKAVSTGPSRNATLNVDQCYSQWKDYWSAEYETQTAGWDIVETTVGTKTFTSAFTNTGSPAKTTTRTYAADTETFTQVNGGFTVGTVTSTYPAGTSTYTDTGLLAFTTTWTNTQYDVSFYTANSSIPTPTIPSCSLPSVVPECQSSWETFISTQLIPSPTPPHDCDIYQGVGRLDHRTQPPCAIAYTTLLDAYESSIRPWDSPACTAVSISGSLCQSVRDNWQLGENDNFIPGTGQFREATSHGSLNIGSGGAWTWLTSSTLGLAKGCTLGCGRCEVTGGTVQLIYWPESTTTASASTGWYRNQTRRPSLSSPQPTATGLVTAVALGTTFTSPTIYISYQNVYAANACSRVGTSIGSTILAIPTESTLSSIYGRMLPCGRVIPSEVRILTAPFTAADLNEPVPYSIYQSQPLCQTYRRDNVCNGTCPMTAPYRPILVVPDQVYRELQPDWADCWGDVNGVYDPPIALTGTSAPDLPDVTTVTSPTATPALPSPSVPGLTLPTFTLAQSAVVGETTSRTLQQGPATKTNDPQQAPASKSDVPQGNPTTKSNAAQQDPASRSTPAQQDPASKSTPAQQDPASNDPQQGPTAKSSNAQQDPAKSNALQQDPPLTSLPAGQNSASNTVADPGHTFSQQANSDPHKTGPSDPVPATAVINSATFAAVQDGSGVAVLASGTTIRISAGATTSLAGQQINVPQSDAVVIGTGSSAKTISLPPVAIDPPARTVITVGAQPVTFAQASNNAGAVIANEGSTTTLAPGATAVALGGQQVSIAAGGSVVIGTGSSATTIALAPVLGSTILLGSQKATILPATNGIVVIDPSTTVTVPANSVATIDGQQISAGNGLAVIGTGSKATAIILTPTSAAETAIVLGAQTVTLSRAASGSGVVVVDHGSTTTIAPGSEATIEGQQISVNTGGVVVGIGSSASTVSVPQATQKPSSTDVRYTGEGSKLFELTGLLRLTYTIALLMYGNV